jgi:hypothetical protein
MALKLTEVKKELKQQAMDFLEEHDLIEKAH